MSTDDVDASDMMGGGNPVEEAGETRGELFTDAELQRYRKEAAEYVSDGVIPIDEVRLNGYLDEGQQLVDGENEAFRAAVLDEIDELPNQPTDEHEESERGEGWDPTEVDFGVIWDEYSFPERVSDTQLKGALTYSKHTAFKGGGAERAIEYGTEAGTLYDVPRRFPGGSKDDTVIMDGVMYEWGGE